MGLLGTGSYSFEVIPRYTNAPKIVFVTEGIVVAKGERFVKILGFLLIIRASHNSGMHSVAARFGNLSTQKKTTKI